MNFRAAFRSDDLGAKHFIPTGVPYSTVVVEVEASCYGFSFLWRKHVVFVYGSNTASGKKVEEENGFYLSVKTKKS